MTAGFLFSERVVLFAAKKRGRSAEANGTADGKELVEDAVCRTYGCEYPCSSLGFI